jgi:hypothetical protein
MPVWAFLALVKMMGMKKTAVKTEMKAKQRALRCKSWNINKTKKMTKRQFS